MGSIICIKCYTPYVYHSLIVTKCHQHRKIDTYNCKDCNNIYNSHCDHIYKWKSYCLQIRCIR